MSWRNRSLKIVMAVCTLGMLLAGTACNQRYSGEDTVMTTDPAEPSNSPSGQSAANETETATFGAGCFWCVEAVFLQLDGVLSVESGYSGGAIENPTYKQVCRGTTDHAEVCQIRYDPSKITFDELLEVFWRTHDPTTLNRQGNDTGSQYRSVVFYHDDRQKELTEQRKRQLDEAGIWDDPIVTEISPFTIFYKAEEYHQDYFNRSPEARYCQVIIRPKVEKFRQVFKDKLKKAE